MSNMELEMKIQNINEQELIQKLEKLGGKYISTSKQFLYVYDLMYINQRYIADLYEFNNETIDLRKNINLTKIENLFYEIDQLLTNSDIEYLQNEFNVNTLSEIFKLQYNDIIQILNNSTLISFLDRFKKTPKKWIRLRKTIEENENKITKETVTLTIKHILKNNNLEKFLSEKIECDKYKKIKGL